MRGELPEVIGQVRDVALQHALGVVVARGIHGLRQVDDHGAIVVDQDVELRQVAMHEAGAQHAHDLPDQRAVECRGLLRREFHLGQARRDIALAVGHQFHQQHAVEEAVGLRHAHAGGGELVERVHLGALPRRFLFLAPETRALLHGAGAPAALHAAAFLVLHRLAEAALVGFLVDLGAADFLAAAHEIDRGLLAALELADDVVDESVLDEGFEGARNLDGGDGRGFRGCVRQAVYGPARSAYP